MNLEDHPIAAAVVVLKDFDGTRTIYLAKMPLPDLISNGDSEEGVQVMRHYAKTNQLDGYERTVYVERN
jgi:hypothetical protein